MRRSASGDVELLHDAPIELKGVTIEIDAKRGLAISGAAEWPTRDLQRMVARARGFRKSASSFPLVLRAGDATVCVAPEFSHGSALRFRRPMAYPKPTVGEWEPATHPLPAGPTTGQIYAAASFDPDELELEQGEGRCLALAFEEHALAEGGTRFEYREEEKNGAVTFTYIRPPERIVNGITQPPSASNVAVQVSGDDESKYLVDVRVNDETVTFSLHHSRALSAKHSTARHKAHVMRVSVSGGGDRAVQIERFDAFERRSATPGRKASGRCAAPSRCRSTRAAWTTASARARASTFRRGTGTGSQGRPSSR